MGLSPAYTVYAEELVPFGHGHPLWFPEPLPDASEVVVGDVGFTRGGRFVRLFNAMLPPHDRLNRNGVPFGFATLRVNATEFLHCNDHYLPAGPLCTDSVSCRKASIGGSVSTWVIVFEVAFYD